MGRNVRGMTQLLSNFLRSGKGIFVCSLTFGLLLVCGSLVYLELGERGDDPSGSGIQSTTEYTERPKTELAHNPADTERTDGIRTVGDRASKSRGLESRVREISADHPGEYGVVVWRPGSGTVASVGGGDRFQSASLAKLPVLLALYREASEKRLSLDERVEMEASDVQPGTGTLQDRPPGTTMTLRECAGYLIKESDNTAWKLLEDRLGKERVRAELTRAGADSTRYEYGEHATTPNDTLKLLRRISDPAYTSPAHSREMMTIMTDTAFEDRLSWGLPADARISHKIGTLGTSFSDAGIVFPPQSAENSEPYYVVVLSRDTSETIARDAMREISLAAYRSLADPEAEPRSP